MRSSWSSRLVAGIATTAMTVALLTVAAPSALSAPASSRATTSTGALRAHVARPSVAAATTLSGLTVAASDNRQLAPAFVSGTHQYEVTALGDSAQATIVATATDPGAAVTVRAAGANYPLSSDAADVPLTRGRNDISVTVTGADGTAGTPYVLSVWRQTSITSRIVRITGATSTVYGGSRMTVVLADGQMPNDCYRSYNVGTNGTYTASTGFDPATGLTTDVVVIPSSPDYSPGRVDLTLTNNCYLGYGYTAASTTATNAVIYTTAVHVDRAVAPDAVTTGSRIDIYGTGVVDQGALMSWITDGSGRTETLANYIWAGEGHAVGVVGYAYGDTWFAGSGTRTLHVGYCPPNAWQVDDTCTSLYQKSINWVAPTPTNLSFSPTNGPVTGGTVVRLKGRFLLTGVESNSTVEVGDEQVDFQGVSYAGSNASTYLEYLNGTDVIQFTMPAGIKPGTVPITVTNDIGTTVARTQFTYSAKPTISAITPSTVANSGGSVITVTGSGFGASGRPTVVIDGVKSPLVTRLSDTSLTAVVPADAGTTGPVAVAVASPVGGGVSSSSSITMADPTTTPTVTRISPATGQASDPVTITGTGFGPTGTAGVSIDGQYAIVTTSSPTSISFQVPATDTFGAKTLKVGATTGTLTKTGAFTVLPADGITSVTPAVITSYATGSTARIAIDGAGFGSRGTVKVGAAAAIAYTATASGSHIAGVTVPTTSAGSLPIVVTPTGSTTPLSSSIQVTAPALTYVGPDPRDPSYGPIVDLGEGQIGGEVLAVPTTGGTNMRIEGAGFGPAGTLTMGTTRVATTSWTDTAITFVAPAHAIGPQPITVTPANSTLAASRTGALTYVPMAPGPPAIARIKSATDAGHTDRNEFDPSADPSDSFTITGTGLAGTTSSTTRVILSDGTQSFTVVPTSVTPASLSFAAPRSFQSGGWKQVQVVTDLGDDTVAQGMYYISSGAQITVSPYTGLCQQAGVSATGGVHYDPAVVTIDNTGSLFGDSGTASVDGVTVTPSSYSTGQLVFSMATLASALGNPWGGKTIAITPTDTSKPVQRVGFTCGVTPSVQTTANGSASALTVPAGTAYTLGETDRGFVGSFAAGAAPGGYQYVSADDYAANGFNQNVHAGTPVAAGDYYVRVALSAATYAAERYLQFTPAPVHVTITGTPITITPVSRNGATFTYKGQLGDGTDGSASDVGYTATSTTDTITRVVYEYRDSACTTNGWTEGLPKNVARLSDCGGDANTVSSWEVRVKSFEMVSNGTDRAIYYQPTLPSIQLTINPKNLSVASARADRVYDGTTDADVAAPTFTGAIDGDDVSIAATASVASFATASPGVNKPVTLSADLALSGSTAGDYTLTNPRPTIVGTITKAASVLSLAASASSVLLSQHQSVTITPTLRDGRTGLAVAGAANAATPVLTSQTPDVCTVSGTTVTAVAAGTCTIAGTDAASINYSAATAESDPQSNTETIDVQVFPAPQRLSVIADDLAFAVGDEIDQTSQFSGLFDGDSIQDVQYDYYRGSTLLDGPPTTPGTYKVIPRGGTLNAVNASVYSNPSAFIYVAGTLTITAQPPTIRIITPTSGPITGGQIVTVTGTLLDTVTSVQIGARTLLAGDFTVNADGSSLSFTTPAVTSAGFVDLVLNAGSISAADFYEYLGAVPGVPSRVTATAGDGSIAVTFTPPSSNGGSAITSYEVSTDGGATWQVAPTVAGPRGIRTMVLDGLVNGTTYPVEVRAVNSIGSGAGSRTTPATPVAAPTPPRTAGAPTAMTATAGDRSITVHFTPPASDGGSPITTYQLSIDGGRTWHRVRTHHGPDDTLGFVIRGVRNGVSYPVTVRAVTANGPGRATRVERSLPNAPRLGNVRPRNRSEIPIPAHPRNYRGPRRYTRARNTSHNGTWAHPIGSLGARQLTIGEAATLNKSSLFDFDSAHLTAAGRAAVRTLARHLVLAHAVTCEGYTDYAGRAGHEKRLSSARAHAICAALVHDGAHVRTATRGYGGARPVVVGGSAVSRAGNRRVVVTVTA